MMPAVGEDPERSASGQRIPLNGRRRVSRRQTATRTSRSGTVSPIKGGGLFRIEFLLHLRFFHIVEKRPASFQEMKRLIHAGESIRKFQESGWIQKVKGGYALTPLAREYADTYMETHAITVTFWNTGENTVNPGSLINLSDPEFQYDQDIGCL